ncbi:hypothetical protein CPJCM30710_08830 [Clostridium polyendosporum]|uniref:Spore germination protein KB n=1 Tax=Clostridium polyendosporum TaxID=69208 RepID=A0A919VFJ5_9CLOT|nr:GerAB/ArcD/ProY family transporter [Clostridium polyendosporum]GIM28217.1 hypothetical protein CPJCM30710_08830 [Clostridium polyendosporum]
MNNNYISKKQLFMIMVLFQLGSSVVVLGVGARQDAWIAVLVGMVGGLLLSFIYTYLYIKNPADISFEKILTYLLGKRFGDIITFIYIMYFTYVVARVIADIRFLIHTTVLHETPELILSVFLMLPMIYAAYHGVEVIGRLAELFFPLIIIIFFFIYLFLGTGESLHLGNLKPVLGHGWGIIFENVLKETMPVPFSETINFMNLYPNVKKEEKQEIRKPVFFSVIFSGIILSATMGVNIMVNSLHVFENLTFPILTTIGTITIGEFIERLDILAIIILMVVNFFKILIWLYSTVEMSISLFGLSLKHRPKIILFISAAAILMSVNLGSIVEHYELGSKVIPPYFHGSLLMGVPLLLMIIAFLKDKKVYIKGLK